MQPPEHDFAVYFYGYFDSEGWETLRILCDAVGGKWDETIGEGGAFTFPKGPPIGVPTMMCASGFPFAIAEYTKGPFGPITKWHLRHQAHDIDSCTLPLGQSPIHRHPTWGKVLSQHSGVIKSAHDIIFYLEQGIPVDI